jgi:tetratricopeptide (TPR) repeat protein
LEVLNILPLNLFAFSPFRVRTEKKRSGLNRLAFLIALSLGHPFGIPIRGMAISGLTLSLIAEIRAETDLRLRLAKEWEKSGDFSRAIQELRLYLTEHPKDEDAYAWMAELQSQKGDPGKALEAYDLGLKKIPQSEKLKKGKAKLLAAAEPKPEKSQPNNSSEMKAKPAVDEGDEKAGEKKPLPKTSDPAKSSEAKESSESAKVKKATPQPKLTAAENARYQDPVFQEAIAKFQSGKATDAQNLLRQVLRKYPGHAGAYYLGGVIRYQAGELGKAKYNFKRSFDYPEKGFNAHYYLGRIAQQEGNHKEALSAFTRYRDLTESEKGKKEAEAKMEESRQVLAKTAKPSSAKEGEESHPKPVAKGRDVAPDEETEASSKENSAHENPHPEETSIASTPLEHAEQPEKNSEPGKAFALGSGLMYLLPETTGPGAAELKQARLDWQNEKLERAVQTLKSVPMRFPNSPNAMASYLNQSGLLLRLGLWKPARDLATLFLETPSRQREVWRRYALYLSALADIGEGKGPEAEKKLLEVKGENGFGPPADEIDYQLALAGETLKDEGQWTQYLAQAEKSAPSPQRKVEMLEKLGMLAADREKWEPAVGYLAKGLESCRDSVQWSGCSRARLRLADIEFRRKRYQDALKRYGEWLKIHPTLPEADWVEYQMGNSLKSQGQLEAALKAYKRVIDNYPYSYWASQAKWQSEDVIWRKQYEGVLD